jgi:hypothetical protein
MRHVMSTRSAAMWQRTDPVAPPGKTRSASNHSSTPGAPARSAARAATRNGSPPSHARQRSLLSRSEYGTRPLLRSRVSGAVRRGRRSLEIVQKCLDNPQSVTTFPSRFPVLRKTIGNPFDSIAEILSSQPRRLLSSENAPYRPAVRYVGTPAKARAVVRSGRRIFPGQPPVG